jgi:hypothetical protein
MVSSGFLRRVALVRTDVSEEPGASFIRVTEIGELRTTQAVTNNRRTLRRNTKKAPGSSETSVLTRATRRNNPEDTILHSHRRENLKSYIVVQFTINTRSNNGLFSYIYRLIPENVPSGFDRIMIEVLKDIITINFFL